MKKILIIFIVLLIGFNANAQLTIKSVDTSKTETIGTLRATYSKLYYNSNVGYYFSIGSTNKFDKTNYITLGTNIEEAIETTNILISIAENKVNTIVENNKIEYTMWGNSTFGINAIFIKRSSGQAGTSSLNVSELKKIIKLLDNGNRRMYND